MFNIYYINYNKAFEIAMLIDNTVTETRTVEKSSSNETTGSVSTDAKIGISFLKDILPSFKVDGEYVGNKTKKVFDSVKVVSTKATFLRSIEQKVKVQTNLNQTKVGELIKILNVSLNIKNKDEILGIKTILNGALKGLQIEGLNEINVSSLFETILKDSAYVLEGILKESQEKIIIKIPMQIENELENQYNCADLEIGEYSIVAIYKGKYKNKELYKKIYGYNIKNGSDYSDNSIRITTDNDKVEEKNDCNNTTNVIEEVHYLDVIAVVQDIHI